MIDWVSLAFKAVTSVSGAIGQVAENKGKKIPMQTEEIEAYSSKEAEKARQGEARLVRRAEIIKWVARFEIHDKHFKFLQRGEVKEQIRDIINSGCTITAIQPPVKEKGRYWIYIHYIEPDVDGTLCRTWYRMPGKHYFENGFDERLLEE